MKLENKIKRFRFEHDGMTQQALADAVGVSRVTINSVENGKFVPSTILAIKIARFFNTTVEEVFQLVGYEEE
jgi:putative transcriptional regulator